MWQTSLKNCVTNIHTLAELLQLDPRKLMGAEKASEDFALRVPREFIARMQPGNYRDPLLLQVLPQGRELQIIPGYNADPLLEKKFNPVPGLLHKYHGRVLMILAGSCAINCRYCFRRHFPYYENNPNTQHWQAVLNYIAKNSNIEEVILSGGEPLLLKDELLQDLFERLAKIAHVTTVRFHTRLPIVIPARITPALVKLLKNTRLKVVMVVHSNHAQELDDSVATALAKLDSVTLLNQAVLLRHINDSVEAMVQLCKRLWTIGVLPYYVHMLDPVQGTAHFQVTKTKAVKLMQEVQARLPGYLVPRLVQEIANTQSKTRIY